VPLVRQPAEDLWCSTAITLGGLIAVDPQATTFRPMWFMQHGRSSDRLEILASAQERGWLYLHDPDARGGAAFRRNLAHGPGRFFRTTPPEPGWALNKEKDRRGAVDSFP